MRAGRPAAGESALPLPTREHLAPRTVFAMPVGPPYGGMTAYSAMLRRTRLFETDRAVLFDTTPPVRRGGIVLRFVHALGKMRALLSLVRRSRAEVVYFMTSGYLGFYEKGVMALLCRCLGARSVLHPVGSFTNFYRSARWGRPLIRFLLRRASGVVAVEDRAQAHIASLVSATPVWLIPNPVDCSEYGTTFTPRPADGPVQVLFSGALVEGKGVLDLIEAVHLFRGELEGARFVMIGAGELSGECERRIRLYGLEGMVEMRGYVDEPAKKKLLAESHVYCLPSHSEGTPISVLEGMAAGLPVVATTVGGIPFAVEDGVQGSLVPPGDVEGLGRALVELAGNEAARRTMGESGFHRVRRLFDIEIVASHFLRRLNSLVDRRDHR